MPEPATGDRNGVRIGIELSGSAGPARGFRRFLTGLVPALLDAAADGPRDLAWTWDAVHADGPPLDPRLGSVWRPDGPLWRHRSLPALARARAWDAAFFPTPTCWWRGPCPAAVLVYDLAPLERPDLALLRGAARWKALLAYRAIRRAGAVLAASPATSRAIRRHWGREAPVVGAGFTALPAAQPIDTPDRFFLMVGPADRRRNHVAQARAFLDAGLPGDLVVTGAPGRGGWLLTGREAAPLRHPRIRFAGEVTDGQMRTLYGRARGLLYASHYEGFGFPVLEARSVGCPVLTSNAGAGPETWRDEGVLLCDPGDPASLVGGIRALSTLPRTAPREEEIRLRYRWGDVASRVLDALRALVAGPGAAIRRAVGTPPSRPRSGPPPAASSA